MMIGLEELKPSSEDHTNDSDERVDNRQTSVFGWPLKGTKHMVLDNSNILCDY